MNTKTEHKLLAIVAVDPVDRVQCRQPGCGHTVYARIHVVQAGEELLVLGSTCFEKRYGSGSALGSASYAGGSGRQLTPEERQLLVENTSLLLARFEEERAQQLRLAAARTQEASRLKRPAPAFNPTPRCPSFPTRLPSKHVPWPWMKHLSSMLYIKLNDGTGWVRVQRSDGQQFLVPWPMFDGWDEALPAHFGTVDYEHEGYALNDVIATLQYLRGMSQWECLNGSWREIVAQILRRSP
jgi:hypothetical protein